MMFPQVSSEFERMCACGRSVCTTTRGLRGSDTSTAVKFFGALSCASHRMRRPSGAIWIDMPSPMPPKPSSMWCESSLKFQVTTPLLLRGVLLLAAGFFGADFAVDFADLDFATLALAFAGFALAGFLAAIFFFARFTITFSLQADQRPRGRTFSAFQPVGGGPKMRSRRTVLSGAGLPVSMMQN